jgi:hypothetical protein
MTGFNPTFTINNRMTAAITQDCEGVRFSNGWVRAMGTETLIK